MFAGRRFRGRATEGITVWIEFVVAVVVLFAALGVVSRVAASRRGTAARTGEPTDGQRGGAWSAAGPIETAFPAERTPRERDIGDAAFVDGLVIGHYLAPFRPAEDRDSVQPEPADLVLDGDDGSETASSVTVDEPPASSVAGGVGPALLEDPADQDLDLDLDLDVDAVYGGGEMPAWGGSEAETDEGASEDAFDDGFGFEDGLEGDW